MKKRYLWILLIGLNSITIVSRGQIRPVPAEVTNAFIKMFPDAKNIEWRDKLTNFAAFFNIKDAKCEAKFTTNGDWINTEKAIQWDSLPAAVKEGLKLSKYADWKGKSSYILLLPGNIIQYHIVVTKNELGRRILFFNQNGQLLTDHLSL